MVLLRRSERCGQWWLEGASSELVLATYSSSPFKNLEPAEAVLFRRAFSVRDWGLKGRLSLREVEAPGGRGSARDLNLLKYSPCTNTQTSGRLVEFSPSRTNRLSCSLLFVLSIAVNGWIMIWSTINCWKSGAKPRRGWLVDTLQCQTMCIYLLGRPIRISLLIIG